MINAMTESTERFINNLLGEMTLDEKIGQLNQIAPANINKVNVIRQENIGSIFNIAGKFTEGNSRLLADAELANRLQQIALETRLKIPFLIGRDVIHGFRTIFPIPLAQAAAFNPDLAEKGASFAAQEACASGIKWTFAPMIDIARDPRWGRVAEGIGEDPYLGAQMAASIVKGYQGDNPALPNKIVACAKHYVGYGSAEGGRDYENGEISEATLRDVYLPPFESAVRAGVGTLMTAFLDLNGTPATANRRLLTDVLRGEWGFDGFVVSDWESISELVQHGIAENRAEAASIALHAGVDMDMVSRAYLETLAINLIAGKVTVDEIDQAVRRILRIKHRAGLFDNPFTDPSRSSKEVLTNESRQLARQFGRECMVLLKNKDDVLPLRDFKKILVAGNFVNAQDELNGTWVYDAHREDVVPIQQALTDIAPKDVDLWFEEDIEKAVTRALGAEVVVLLLGEHPCRSGENANLSDLRLPPGQAAYVDAMINLGKPVVLVIFAGRPLVITRQMSQVDAVLYAWHPGIEGGAALGEILFGIHSPSGRLPITFPRATGQVPIYYNHKNSGRPVTAHGEYRTRYLDLPPMPLLPFGFGLTYTSFKYANLRLGDQMLRGQISISADITNTGSLAGSELVQLYIRDLVGSLTRPVRELKGFQRIMLQPGETGHASFIINEEMLAYTHSDGSRGVEPGLFQAWMAPDCTSGLLGEFSL
jgi:beta-glucosidase